ncbi:MAG: thymidylate synthase complementing protein ThyX [Desulfobacterales bacterium SG8_35]|nr:MAG: thymidylate synthase complementing protein ThyX [Desulfobacterales bacterium SG8_35]
MKVIAPYCEILEDLDKQSLSIRIEACGRICYKSEDKITAESAEPFIRNIIKHGHNSVTEMAVLTLKVLYDAEAMATPFFNLMPKFLLVDKLDRKELLITGSVRAFRELYQANPTVKMVKAIAQFLGSRHPLFYEDLLPERGLIKQEGVRVEKVPLENVDGFTADLLAKHRHVAVLFVVNRAVTHEIVRHRPVSYLQESQRYCRYSQDKFGNEVTFIRPMFFQEGSAEYSLWEKAMEDTEKIYLKLLETSSPQAARTVLPNSCKTELITFANLLEWFHIFKLRTSKGAEPSMREVMIPLLHKFQKRYPAIFNGIQADI